MKRKGFTLIELVVAMTIFFILIYMAFASFAYILTFSSYNKNRENIQENISTVTDQITKEIRQTYTEDDGTGEFGIKYPTYADDKDTVRNISTISTPDEPLNNSTYLKFGSADHDSSDDPLNPILMFYTMDNNGKKHRISYTLGVPTDGHGYYPPHYKGTPRRYWPSKKYEPCEILYSNLTKDGSGNWTVGISNQPVTEQVITNFYAIRPKWSNKVIQIVIEAMVKAPTKTGYEKVRYVAQITLRQ